MQQIEIVEGGLEDLKVVYERFKQDFDADERKDFHQLETLIRMKNYKLLLGKFEESGGFIGYAFVFELEKIDALWLDYLAIHPEFQNDGFGTLFFQKIANSNMNKIGIFTEVEIPEIGEARETKIRRIHFYERMGAKKLKTRYIFPSNNGGLPMYLYFTPADNVKILPKESIKEAITAVFDTIHSDAENRKKILDKIIPTISDEYF